MQLQKLTFRGAAGAALSARLDLPDGGRPRAYALFAHCFTCNKNYKAIAGISHALARTGIAVLRFDFTGLGESEGDFADTNFSSNVEDLVAAADFLRGEYGQAPQLLIGHSLGGAAVLQAAARIPSSRAVVTLAAPGDPSYLVRSLGRAAETIEAQGEAEVTIGGQTFRIKKQFLDDLALVAMQATIRSLNRALLVMHSPADRVVDIDSAVRIFQAARYPKSFISLDGADHLLSERADAEYAAALIAAWVPKYL
jgi:alpha-beta hydrolase superfamily lysophospholipase